MAAYDRNRELSELLAEMHREIANLKRFPAGQVPSFITAYRPVAADSPGLIIFNTTTGKHEGSNGTVWTALY